MCSPGRVRNASSSPVRSRTVRSSVATATPRRGICASVSARAATPAIVSRMRASRSIAMDPTSGAEPCPADPSANQTRAPTSPIPASPRLRGLSTWKPKLVRPQPRRRTARDVEVEGVLPFFDLDRLADRLRAVLGPGAQLVLPRCEAPELVATARLADRVVRRRHDDDVRPHVCVEVAAEADDPLLPEGHVPRLAVLVDSEIEGAGRR